MKKIVAICSLLVVTAMIVLATRYSVSIAMELAFWLALSCFIGYLAYKGLMAVKIASNRRLKRVWAILPAVILAAIISISGISMTMFEWEVKPIEEKFLHTALFGEHTSDGFEFDYRGQLDKITGERDTLAQKWGVKIDGEWTTEARVGPSINCHYEWNPAYWWFHNN